MFFHLVGFTVHGRTPNSSFKLHFIHCLCNWRGRVSPTVVRMTTFCHPLSILVSSDRRFRNKTLTTIWQMKQKQNHAFFVQSYLPWSEYTKANVIRNRKILTPGQWLSLKFDKNENKNLKKSSPYDVIGREMWWPHIAMSLFVYLFLFWSFRNFSVLVKFSHAH